MERGIMKAIAAFVSSVLLFISSAVQSVIPGIKPAPRESISVTGAPTPAAEGTVTVTPTKATQVITPAATTAPINAPAVVKTPSWALGDGTYVIGLRPGESIRVTSIVPQKGHTTLSVELPPSGAPPGVYFTVDQAEKRNIYIHAGPSAQPGKYSWRQSFKTTFDSGVAPGDLSLGIELTIVSPL